MKSISKSEYAFDIYLKRSQLAVAKWICKRCYEIQPCSEISKLFRNFNIAMKFQRYFQISKQLLNFKAALKFQRCYEISTLLWNFNVAMKFQRCSETSTLLANFIATLKFQSNFLIWFSFYRCSLFQRFELIKSIKMKHQHISTNQHLFFYFVQFFHVFYFIFIPACVFFCFVVSCQS